MVQPQNASVPAHASKLCSFVRENLPKRVNRDSVHLYRQTLEYEVPLLVWRLKAKTGDGELTRSQVYTIPTKPPTQWQFVIFKDNAATKKSDFEASLFRAGDSQVDQVTVSGKFTALYDSTKKVACSMDFSGTFSSKSVVSSLLVTANVATFKDALEKDIFILRCELEVLQSDDSNSCCDEETRSGSVVNCLNKVWETIDKGDVITIKLDDYVCRAHKSILSAWSPVFAAMFRHDTIEQRTNSVTIHGLEKSMFELIMQFMYTSRVAEADWNEENASKLLLVADQYMLNALKDKCEDFLIEKLSSDNCVQLLKLGTDCSAKRLQREALHYVSSKFHQNVSSSLLKKKLSDQKFIQSVINIASEL